MAVITAPELSTEPSRRGRAITDLRTDAERERLVIVGGGMAGFGLCNRLVRNQAFDHYRMTIFGEEPTPAYDRVNLSQFFHGRSAEQLQLAGRDWYEANRIDLQTECRIVEIDRAGRQVIDDAGRRHVYGRLVLATGSRAWVPPIRGTDSEGVYVYRSLSDLQRILDHVRRRHSKVGAVVGGGLLGLEAANVLLELGVATTVVECAPGLMPRQLDPNAARELKQRVESLGIDVQVVRRTEAIVPQDDGRLSIRFANAAEIPADIVILAAGVRPNDELGRQSGLAIGPRGGMVVDEGLCTSDPNIFAVGECACFREHVYGLVAPCYRMADVLASRLGGEDERFRGADESAELKLLGVKVAALGRAIGELRSGVTITQQDESGYRKLILERGCVVGAACVGEWDELPQIRQAIHSQARLWPRQRIRFKRTGSPWTPKGALPIAEWPANSIVCSCVGVTKSTITDLVSSGVRETTALAQHTGASTACGSCKSLLCELAGDRAEQVVVPGAKVMLIASLVAGALCVMILSLPPIPYAVSVQSIWRNIDVLWRSDVARQITGFTLLGLLSVALMFSLRKRSRWFALGSYGFWRATHGVLGAAVLMAMAIHTGMRLGENLNFALAITFVATAAIGSFAGIASGLESRTEGSIAMLVRRWRPRMTKLHLWLFWPLPALIAIHIFSFYWYSD